MIASCFRNGIAGMALAASLALASGAALANPGMGDMGGEAPQPKGGGCGGCGGGGDSSISRQDASQRAGDAARNAVNQGGGITIGGGGRPSEDMTGAIAQLGQANADAAGTGPARHSLPPQVMLTPSSPIHAPPLGSTTVSSSAIPPSRANMPPPPSDPWDLNSKLGIGGPVHLEPLPPTPPGEPTPEQIWNAPPKPPAPQPDYSPELQELLQPKYDAEGRLIQQGFGGAPI